MSSAENRKRNLTTDPSWMKRFSMARNRFKVRFHFLSLKENKKGLELRAFEPIAVQGSRRDAHLRLPPIPSNNKAGAAMVDFLSLYFGQKVALGDI